MIPFDVAVVGGGMAGVSAAGELAEHRSVVLLEQEDQLAYHTTGRSAAAFLESYGSAQIQALTGASRRILAETGLDALLSPRPLLWIAGPGQRGLDEFIRANPTLRHADKPAVRRLCPPLREDYVQGAAIEPAAQDIDVAGLHQHYLRKAKLHGAQVVTKAEVLGGEHDNGLWTLRTTQDDVQARIVVNAAGAWADEVAARLGARPVGLVPCLRTAAVARAAGVDPAWPLVCDLEETFYFRPEGQGVLISPADQQPTVPQDAKPSDIDVALALERVNEATTLGLRSITTAWAGLRTFAGDHNPVVGFDPVRPGFFWLAGQGGYGIQTACGLAELTAALIHTGTPPPPLQDVLDHLSPARFTG